MSTQAASGEFFGTGQIQQCSGSDGVLFFGGRRLKAESDQLSSIMARLCQDVARTGDAPSYAKLDADVIDPLALATIPGEASGKERK